MALTLPLSVFALHPLLLLAGVVSAVTGGDSVQGNAFSDAFVVVAFIGIALANVAIVRLLAVAWRPRRQQHVTTSVH